MVYIKRKSKDKSLTKKNAVFTIAAGIVAHDQSPSVVPAVTVTTRARRQDIGGDHQ